MNKKNKRIKCNERKNSTIYETKLTEYNATKSSN